MTTNYNSPTCCCIVQPFCKSNLWVTWFGSMASRSIVPSVLKVEDHRHPCSGQKTLDRSQLGFYRRAGVSEGNVTVIHMTSGCEVLLGRYRPPLTHRSDQDPRPPGPEAAPVPFHRYSPCLTPPSASQSPVQVEEDAAAVEQDVGGKGGQVHRGGVSQADGRVLMRSSLPMIVPVDVTGETV